MLGLGERQLHFLGQCPREVVATERQRPLPDDLARIGNDQVRAIGADIENDGATLFATWRVVFRNGGIRIDDGRVATLLQQFVRCEVRQCERSHLHDVALDARRIVLAHILRDYFALHRE